MSFIDNIVGMFDIDGLVADIKNKIGTFYTFPSRINAYEKKISNGAYSGEIVNKLAEIKALQAKLDPQVEEFISMTNSIDFSDFEMSGQYLQNKFNELLGAGNTALTFLTEVDNGIKTQEQNFQELDAMLAGESTALIKLKSYLTFKNVLLGLGGFWIIKKIIK